MSTALRIALTATSLALTAAQRCAETVATLAEIGLVACWALSERSRRD